MLKYPFSASTSGDLITTASESDVISSRVRCVLDMQVGDRPLLPEFGSSLDQFAPTDGIASLNAELLKADLTQWAGKDKTVQFSVTPLIRGNGRYQYKIEYV